MYANLPSFWTLSKVESFVTTYDLQLYEQLTWLKAGKWFKEIVKDYDRFMIKFTTSGQAQPDFHGYVEGKDHVYYYRLYVQEKPDTHKALTAVLSDEIFSESGVVKKKTSPRGENAMKGMRAKQAVLQSVADSMTDRMLESKSHQSKRDEKMKLETVMGQIHMNLLQLPMGTSGDPACAYFAQFPVGEYQP